jgi:allophanate hydrolase subunit 2
METDPSLEFEFYLADRLSMTVGQLRAQMSNQEFVQWSIYHARKAQRMELQSMKGG